MEGKMSKEIQCKCCKEYWWEMNIHSKSGLCPNCYDYVADIEAKLAESEDCNNILYKCLTEKDIEIETQKEENAELQKQLEEKEKKIEKLREWLSQCEADRKSEQEKKNLAFKKWKESNEDALCLQQIYSHLGVEAYGEDIQEQAIKRIDAFKAINNYPIKFNIKPYIFTAKYECWSIRQTENNHKYLILVEEEGKLKPAGSYSTKSKRLLMYNVKYTPPLTILEKIVTSCELFERM